MSLLDLGARPADVTAIEHFAPWFLAIVERLFNRCDFVVNGSIYRFAELEAYYHAPGHLDYFSHRQPITRENGRWYFHRTGSQYRGGSFKGLDLTFGDGTAYFGILIRSIIDPSGTIIDGPSLTVDHVLARTRAKNVPELDGIIGGRKVWDASSPLAIRESSKTRSSPVYQCSRVGMSLKRAIGKREALSFVARPYRFLMEPLRISKGKVHLVLALHRLGESADAIHKLTGCPRKAIARYIEHYQAGNAIEGFEAYIGRELSTGELCQLIGTWVAAFGGSRLKL
jgi:hypothetical protein